MKTICSKGIVNQGHHDSRQHFGTEEKYGSFDGSESYRKTSYVVFWNKGMFPNNFFEIPLDWTIVKDF
jgi:hypothetical protein